MTDDKLVPALYALICAVWGSTWLVIKIGLVGVPPFLGAGLRFLLSSAVIGAFIAARGIVVRLDRDDKIAIWSCGLLSFTFSYACVYWAEQYISSGLTAILYSTMPLMVALLSRFWTRSETLSVRKIGGILVAMAGTVGLFWPNERVSSAELWGMTAALASVVAAAINLVMLKRYSQKTDIYALNAVSMGIGAACLLGLSAATESYAGIHWSWANVSAILYLSLIGSVVAFLSYCYLVKVMDATKLSMSTLIIPIVAVFLGRLLLKEKTFAGTWLAMGTVLAGVAISLLPSPIRRGRGGALTRP